MQSGARVGLSVGVLVLVSTANWQGTQPHSTRFTSAHSIEFDLVNFISYNLGRGWAGTRKAVLALIAVSLLSQSRCRSRNCTTDYSRFTGSKWPGAERRFALAESVICPPLSSLSLSLCRHCPGTCGLRRAFPLRFRGRRHGST